MKALSVKQPWAHLICPGPKRIETRSWYTQYRGDLLICSSRNFDDDFESAWAGTSQQRIWFGHIIEYGKAICIATLSGCRRMTHEDETLSLCRCYPAAYSWVLENIRPVEPFSVKGKLGLFDVELPEGIAL